MPPIHPLVHAHLLDDNKAIRVRLPLGRHAAKLVAISFSSQKVSEPYQPFSFNLQAERCQVDSVSTTLLQSLLSPYYLLAAHLALICHKPHWAPHAQLRGHETI